MTLIYWILNIKIHQFGLLGHLGSKYFCNILEVLRVEVSLSDNNSVSGI